MLKRRVAAALLSLLSPGLGHIYARRFRRGLIIVAAYYVILFGGGLFGAWSSHIGFWVRIGVVSCLFLVAMADSIVVAGTVIPSKRYNRWFVYVGFVILSAGFFAVVHPNQGVLLGYDLHRMPSGSMEPTIRIGDAILVDTRHYADRDPQPGDVITFRFPPEPETTYIKRVIAIGGQTVFVDETGIAHVDGKPVHEPYVQSREVRPDWATKEIQIPEGQLFTLGDSRWRSSDSRQWGNVPVENVLGRATCIPWSEDPERRGMSLLKEE